MKIINAKQIKELDAASIINEKITSVDLMERASKMCLTKILQYADEEKNYIIFCGKGNNGGDGLCIGRLLSDRNRKVIIYIINHREDASAEFYVQLESLKKNHEAIIHYIDEADQLLEINFKDAIVVDALIGSGLNKPAESLLLNCINYINQSSSFTISIDVPSGISADFPDIETSAVMADVTLTFQLPKFSFMFPEVRPFVGKMDILDIGLDIEFINQLDTPIHYINLPLIRKIKLTRPYIAHKGNFGHALLICGHKGMIGAAHISGKACLRAGAGLLTIKVPACGLNSMQQSLPEAMIIDDPENNFTSFLPDVSFYNAIGIGCGIGKEKQTQNILKLLIQNYSGKLVIDADALNILSENKTWLSFLPPYTILTPHPKEFDRLAGTHTNSFERFKTAQEFAKKHKIIIVLKGANTACIMPDGNVFFNSTGNPGLSKGGSGDALTGIITGLLARGYAPNHAVIMGVFIHGFAADLALKKNHEESLLITDVIEKIPKAFQKIDG